MIQQKKGSAEVFLLFTFMLPSFIWNTYKHTTNKGRRDHIPITSCLIFLQSCIYLKIIEKRVRESFILENDNTPLEDSSPLGHLPSPQSYLT